MEALSSVIAEAKKCPMQAANEAGKETFGQFVRTVFYADNCMRVLHDGDSVASAAAKCPNNRRCFGLCANKLQREIGG